MSSEHQRQGLERYIRLFNNLDSDSRDSELAECTIEAVRFSDPFVELQGRAAMANYLAHFVSQVEQPRFEIDQRGWDGDVCLLRWRFSGQLRGREWHFPGISELHFDRNGRVVVHMDHWDAARYFYRRLPFIGWLIGKIEARLRP